jgi:ribosomal-protein-alanine N-acetyltransferase
MTVRPAGAGDVAAVAALEQQVFGVDAWSETTVRSELTGARRTGVVAELEGQLAGYAVTARAGEIVDLQRIAVRADRRRGRLGRCLLAAVLPEDDDATVEAVMLEVSAVNDTAVAFYRATGFTVVARRRRYYRDGSDALVMRRPHPHHGRTRPAPAPAPGERMEP